MVCGARNNFLNSLLSFWFIIASCLSLLLSLPILQKQNAHHPDHKFLYQLRMKVSLGLSYQVQYFGLTCQIACTGYQHLGMDMRCPNQHRRLLSHKVATSF